MIPYIEQPSVSIGPLTIHAFGAIVAAAVYAGLAIGARRFTGVGLDRALGERLAWWAVVGGFLGAHLFSVLFYFPQKVAENPLVLFKLWEDISSFGSILGGSLGIWLFFRLRARSIDTLTRLAYLDVAAFVFPVSLMIGRIACSLAHDHPGTVTDFPLAVSLESAPARSYIEGVYADAGRGAELPPPDVLATLGFHDLGWYEFLLLAATVVPAVLLLDRRSRRPGFFLAAFIVLYMPARFLLDFLRVSDVRSAGLTPAQWGALAALAVLAVIVTSVRRRVAMPTGDRHGVPNASPADHASARAEGRGCA
ncbi:MAG: hypothetical protein AMXMBFR55_16370 [Gemmatimonadota bacterium]